MSRNSNAKYAHNWPVLFSIIIHNKWTRCFGMIHACRFVPAMCLWTAWHQCKWSLHRTKTFMQTKFTGSLLTSAVSFLISNESTICHRFADGNGDGNVSKEIKLERYYNKNTWYFFNNLWSTPTWLDTLNQAIRVEIEDKLTNRHSLVQRKITEKTELLIYIHLMFWNSSWFINQVSMNR